jgi:hypothetical protein
MALSSLPRSGLVQYTLCDTEYFATRIALVTILAFPNSGVAQGK